MAELIYLSNGMAGNAYRNAINNNFQRINIELEKFVSNEDTMIITDIFITDIKYNENTKQIVANSDGVVFYELIDSEWVELAGFKVDGTGLLALDTVNDAIGYPYNGEPAEALNNKPIGFNSRGEMVLAGTQEFIETDAIEARGWLRDGYILFGGRIALLDNEVPEEAIAGQLVYVDDVNGGYTFTKPTEPNHLIQAVGWLSEDRKFINIINSAGSFYVNT